MRGWSRGNSLILVSAFLSTSVGHAGAHRQLRKSGEDNGTNLIDSAKRVLASVPSAGPSLYPPGSRATKLPTVRPIQTLGSAQFESSISSPTQSPTRSPSQTPSRTPSRTPSLTPSQYPSISPAQSPTSTPSQSPNINPSQSLSSTPSKYPSTRPNESPSSNPSQHPTSSPSQYPNASPSQLPSSVPPSSAPSGFPSVTPTREPSTHPSSNPSIEPTVCVSDILSDNFDNGISKRMWAVNTGVSSLGCGSSRGNALYFNDDESRIAETSDLITVCGGNVKFAIVLGEQFSNTCESVDTGDDVFLDYSTDGGATWTNMRIWSSGDARRFRRLTVAIPPAAQTKTTRFRWVQPNFFGVDFDNWAIDEVTIDGSFPESSPSASPSEQPITAPSVSPSVGPTASSEPSVVPTSTPSAAPSISSAPSINPTPLPSLFPSSQPTPCTADFKGSVSDKFDTGVSRVIWSSITGISSSSCGSVSGNALYFNENSRVAETVDMVTICGGNVQFAIIFGSGGGSCENADPGESVFLQYSINGGNEWFDMASFDPEQIVTFTGFSIAIPDPARTTSTRFRWSQPLHNGFGLDNWAIDEVVIDGRLADLEPSAAPSSNPSAQPSVTPSWQPTLAPNAFPSAMPSVSSAPTATQLPSSMPSPAPTPCLEKGIVGDNFDTGISNILWLSTTGEASLGCGSASGLALYFTEFPLRIAETVDLVTTCGGFVKFSITGGTFPGLFSCEPAENNEGVDVEYSVDGGSVWSRMTSINLQEVTVFTSFSVPIPEAAQTISTRFRWIQTSFSGVGFDNWAIDDVQIDAKTLLGILVPTVDRPSDTKRNKPDCNSTVVIKDGFDDGSINQVLWQNNSGTIDFGCGSHEGEALYFGDGKLRVAETVDLDTFCGGNINFAILIGDGRSPGDTCEKVDFGDIVVLEYSIDRGVTWVGLRRWGESDSSSEFTSYSVTIPSAARTRTTRFRWQQESFGGAPYDHWALDTVEIDVSVLPPFSALGKFTVPPLTVPPAAQPTPSIFSPALVSNRTSCGNGCGRLTDDFDNGYDKALWTQVTGTNSSPYNQCGAVSGSALAFNDAVSRVAETIDLEASCGGNIKFSMIIGGEFNGICEFLDRGDEVHLDFSTDYGNTWTTLKQWGPSNTQIGTFVAYSVPLPPSAQTPETRFRWIQPKFCCKDRDNWAIDTVSIDLLACDR